MKTTPEAREALLEWCNSHGTVSSQSGLELLADLDEMEHFLRSEGYQRCDISACNCGSWHGGHAMRRLKEISEEVRENGATTLESVRNLKAEVKRLRNENEGLNNTIEELNNILADRGWE